MARFRKLKISAAVLLSFSVFGMGIIMLLMNGRISGELAGLMFVALFGLYVGIGILIAVYRLISSLD